MKRVYVVQEPLRIDRETGRAVLRFPLDDARRYGELRPVLGWSDVLDLTTEQLIDKMILRMDGYDKDDFLLVCGNPTMIGIAIHIAIEAAETVNVLEWDKVGKRYDLRSFSSFYLED